MTYVDAIILGIVEGLTEFLPISSTGHMILTNQFLALEHSETAKAFEIIIQSGAMFAVISLMRVLTETRDNTSLSNQTTKQEQRKP